MWKACGLASIDGVLYMTVSRHLNPDYAPWIQQTWDASMIMSRDHAVFSARHSSCSMAKMGKGRRTITFTRFRTTAHGITAIG